MNKADAVPLREGGEPQAPWGVRFPDVVSQLDPADHELLLRRSVSDLERRVPVSLFTYVLLFGVLVLHPSLREMNAFWLAMGSTIGLTVLRAWVGRHLGDQKVGRALEAQRVFVLLTVLQGCLLYTSDAADE